MKKTIKTILISKRIDLELIKNKLVGGGSEFGKNFNIINLRTSFDYQFNQDSYIEQFYSGKVENPRAICKMGVFNGKLMPVYRINHLLHGKENFREFYFNL